MKGKQLRRGSLLQRCMQLLVLGISQLIPQLVWLDKHQIKLRPILPNLRIAVTRLLCLQMGNKEAQ